MAAKGIVLFGHGARDPEWAGPMKRVAARIAARSPDTPVGVAFMEFLTPTLNEAVDALAATGIEHITVVPVFLAQGGHLKRDVPLLVAEAAARHPALTVTQVIAAGESDGVVEALADYALGVA